MPPLSPRVPAVALLLACAVPGQALPQTAAPGGRQLTFGSSFGLAATDNADFAADGEARADATARFRLGLSSATRVQDLAASLDFGLRAEAGPGRDEDLGLLDPSASLAYSRRSRGSELRLDASVSRSEISDLDPLELVIDDTLDPLDLETLLGQDRTREGTRTRFSLGAALETGRDAPFGVTYSLGVAGTRYSEEVDTLDDTTRGTAGLGLRFDLSEVATATADFGYATYDEAEPRDDSVSVGAGLSRRGATWDLGTRLGLVSDGAGTRTTLSVDGGLERRTGALDGTLGVTRLDNGDLQLIGSADARYATRDAALSFGLVRRVTQTDGDTDGDDDGVLRNTTTVSAGYTREVTRLWQVGLDTRYVWTETVGRDADADGTDRFGQIGVDLSRRLTDDWTVTMGLDHRFEADADGGDIRGNTVSLSLGRSFGTTF